MKDLKNKRDFENLIKNKIADAEEFFTATLNPNDPDLSVQITLGDNWDNPFELTKACDRHSAYYARWATLLRSLKRDRQRLEERKKVWESKIKVEIERRLFELNKQKGMTANNAKPTGASVDYRFSKIYNSSNDTFTKYNNPIDEIDKQIDIVEVIVKAFEMRKDMLVSMTHLVNKMIDKDLMVHKMRKLKNGK
jgi:hypothetical protein